MTWSTNPALDNIAKEVLGTRRENWNFPEPKAYVQVEVPYAYRIEFVKDLLQSRAFWPFPPEDHSGNQINFPALRCSVAQIAQSRDCVATSLDQEIQGYKTSLINLEYEILHGELYEEIRWSGGQLPKTGCETLYVEETFNPEVEFLDTAPELFRWKSDGTKLERGEALAIPWFTATLSRTVYGYNYLPVALNDWIGRIHNVTHSSDILITQIGRLVFPANTLLMSDPKITYGSYNLDNNNKTFNISAELSYQPAGWNKWLRFKASGGVDASGFEEVQVYDDTPGQPPVDFKPVKEQDMSEFIFDQGTRFQRCPIAP